MTSLTRRAGCHGLPGTPGWPDLRQAPHGHREYAKAVAPGPNQVLRAHRDGDGADKTSQKNTKRYSLVENGIGARNRNSRDCKDL